MNKCDDMKLNHTVTDTEADFTNDTINNDTVVDTINDTVNDTIAAIATGLSESGIGIIRISGPESYQIISRIFVNGKGQMPSLKTSHRVHHGFIMAESVNEPESVDFHVSRETLTPKFSSIGSSSFTEKSSEKSPALSSLAEKSTEKYSASPSLSERSTEKSPASSASAERPTEIELSAATSTSTAASTAASTACSHERQGNEDGASAVSLSPSSRDYLHLCSTLDEVLMINMKAPHTYTGEDTIEIDCHGGVLMMRRILERVIKAGARVAEPGEFTKRAFLNGRIDLSQAEAVIQLIQAKNDKALHASMNQLKGSVSHAVRACRAQILNDTAFIEAALDDPEHISLDDFPKQLRADVSSVLSNIQKLIDSAENGRLIHEGIQTVILGKPNAGKSSLLNALLEEDRAIVTDIAGTTRDTLEAQLQIHGLTLNIIDTAGIRETEDKIEQIGVERAMKVAKNADLILYVVDGSRALDASDKQILHFIQKENKSCIILINKSDLPESIDVNELIKSMTMTTDQTKADDIQKNFIHICAKTGKGISVLEDRISDIFERGGVDWNDEVMITSVREKEALVQSRNALQEVIRSIDDGMPEDFYTIDLMEAYRLLGLILGEEVEEDLVNEIFSKFCMGK